ncbi:hypothetical protein RMATCC62417_01558 [Rhizopus microsporus]|nr:hypothetical protein RMATCC62417_01558 [Rhizopus microsporus]
MCRPRSDLGRLQFLNIQFKFDQEKLVGVTLLSRKPKEARFKTSKLRVIDVTKNNLCPARTLHMFVKKTSSMRTSFSEDHTLFLAYIKDTTTVCSVLPSTVSNWAKNHMKCAGVDIKKHKAHSLRPASRTFAVQSGNTIDSIKQHAHWSDRSNTFEQLYLKPFNSQTKSSRFTNSTFSSPEYHTIASSLFTSATA